MWESCHVQRFFLGKDKRYFRVDWPSDDLGSTVTDDLVKAMIDGKDRREREEENQLTTVRSTQDKVDLTPWMQRTGWLRMFVGRDMQSLASFSHKPSKTEPKLTILWERTEAMLRWCGEGINDCVERNWRIVLFWLNSPKLTEPSSRPFRMEFQESTLEKYTHTWARMICMCYRAFDTEDKVCPVKLLKANKYSSDLNSQTNKWS
jgi:hypothetical protein